MISSGAEWGPGGIGQRDHNPVESTLDPTRAKIPEHMKTGVGWKQQERREEEERRRNRG